MKMWCRKNFSISATIGKRDEAKVIQSKTSSGGWFVVLCRKIVYEF
jgi:hypothetical protein